MLDQVAQLLTLAPISRNEINLCFYSFQDNLIARLLRVPSFLVTLILPNGCYLRWEVLRTERFLHGDNI